jgi:hypothetical protein
MFVTKIGCIAVSNAAAAPTGPTLVFDLDIDNNTPSFIMGAC